MKTQQPIASDDEHRVIKFRPRTLAHPPGQPHNHIRQQDGRQQPQGVTGDLSRFERDRNEPDDFRHRMLANVAALAFTVALTAIGIWLAVSIADLRKAVERNELVLVYQPIVELGTQQIIGAEALARWNHPRLGQVSPAHFIAVAEASGLIEGLGEYVLREACLLGAKWPGRSIAVNISPVQLRNQRFTEKVFGILAETVTRRVF